MEALTIGVGPAQTLAEVLNVAEDDSEKVGNYAVGVLSVLVGLVVIWESWLSVKSTRLLEHIAYVFGTGLMFSHLVRHIDGYDDLFDSLGGRGSLEAEVLIMVLFVLMPAGVCLMSMWALVAARWYWTE